MDEIPLGAREAAALLNMSLAGFWKGVRLKRLPDPVYPLPRSPRWFPSELREALLKTRAAPAEQAAARAAWRVQPPADTAQT